MKRYHSLLLFIPICVAVFHFSKELAGRNHDDADAAANLALKHPAGQEIFLADPPYLFKFIGDKLVLDDHGDIVLRGCKTYLDTGPDAGGRLRDLYGVPSPEKRRRPDIYGDYKMKMHLVPVTNRYASPYSTYDHLKKEKVEEVKIRDSGHNNGRY